MHGTAMLLFYYATPVVFGFASLRCRCRSAPLTSLPRLNALSLWLFQVRCAGGSVIASGGRGLAIRPCPIIAIAVHFACVALRSRRLARWLTIPWGVPTWSPPLYVRTRHDISDAVHLEHLHHRRSGDPGLADSDRVVRLGCVTAVSVRSSTTRQRRRDVVLPALCSGTSATRGLRPRSCRSSASSPRSSPRCSPRKPVWLLPPWSTRRSASWRCPWPCGHTTYVTGAVLLPFFSFMTFLIAVPTGIKVLQLDRHHVGTGKLTSSRRCCSASRRVLCGGPSACCWPAHRWISHVSDTYFVIAHFHYVLVLA